MTEKRIVRLFPVIFISTFFYSNADILITINYKIPSQYFLFPTAWQMLSEFRFYH